MTEYINGTSKSDFESDGSHTIQVDPDVIAYMDRRGRDFRISTSCSGPILLPTTYKSPSPTDIAIKINDHTLYISRYQAPYIHHIHVGLIPFDID
ncbi:MAG: hypothetical protein LBV40_08050 [Methanomicrobiales archaeon]|jgi:hypothetical protein|nr:hypothetical protein [Methanomicrobiales archaeon]